MFKKIIRTIHYLRVYLFAFILFAFFYYLGLHPVNISQFIGAGLSRAVGMSMSVQENPFNHLALQLQEKENKLVQKENELNQREADLKQDKPTLQDRLMVIMATGIIILFILILINFYLDYRRRKQLHLNNNKI